MPLFQQVKNSHTLINQRVVNAQRLMLDAEITSFDYKEIKNKIEALNDELIRKKANLSSLQDNFKELLKFGALILKNIDEFYDEASLSEKQLLIGSVFPEKLAF